MQVVREGFLEEGAGPVKTRVVSMMLSRTRGSMGEALLVTTWI